MATQAQIAANCENAKQSTGPRTTEGKARASRNARKHGLLARDVVIFGEKSDAYEELRDAVFDEVESVGVREEALAETIAVCIFKNGRWVRVEASTFRYEAFDQQAAYAQGHARTFEKSISAAIAGQSLIVSDKAQRDAAIAQAEKAATARDCETLARAFENASMRNNTWTKLSRYAVENERPLYRALRELERLQAIRKKREADIIDVTPSSPEE